MRKIESYTPAQLFFIVFENEIQIQKLLKATFFDLMLRKVLTFEVKTAYSNKKGEDVDVVFITIGPFFSVVELNYLEKYFLSPFKDSSSLSIQYKNYLDILKEEIPYELDLLKEFKKTNWFESHFEKKWYRKKFKLKPEFKELKSDIQNELNEIQLPNSLEFLNFDLEENFLSGKIFLLKRKLYEHLLSTNEIYSFVNKRFDQYLINLKPKPSSYYGCSGASSGCSSFSGCSGCGSGCSGCGGCGGCS